MLRIADRVYNFLKTLKDKEVFFELKSDESTIHCNSKKLKITKSGNRVSLGCYKDVSVDINLDSVKHYTFILDNENNCEKTILEMDSGSSLKIFLNVEDYNVYKNQPNSPVFDFLSEDDQELLVFGDEK